MAVTNVQTGVTRNLTTDEAGEYTAPNLNPGKYSVRVTAAGFKGVDRQDILLEVGKDIRIDLQLTTGEVSQTIEVTGAVPLIDTTSVTLGGTLSNDTINELPLNGRNYINLLSLRPGVQQYPGGGAWTQASNGLRVEDQNWIIDGLDNNESQQGQPVINSPGTAGDSATILPIDAIQEFNVEENPKAEFGWKPGAVVNIGLKSGTNQLHGTAYAFGRSDSWDARNVFNQDAQTPLALEQWGATAGGHIIKNKLFYFGGFENQRYSLGIPQPLRLPSSATIQQQPDPSIGIPAAEAALAAANVSLNQLSLNLLPLYHPTSDPSGKVLTSFTATNSSYNTIGKVDYNLSSHHTLSGSYFFGNDNNVSEDFPVTQSQFLSTFHIRTQAAAGHYTWAPTANLVNELRLGFVRYNRPVQGVDHATPPGQYGINTGVTNPAEFGMPTIRVANFATVGAFVAWPNLLGPDNNYDFLDQLSYSHGKHAFKFGGEIRLSRILSQAYSNGRGTFSFNSGAPLGTGSQAITSATSLEAFLAGAPTAAVYVVGNPVRNYRQSSFAAFGQDDWRVTSKLTLNLGLRWEYTGPLSEANNLIANWTPSQGLIQAGKGVNSVYNRQKTNFAPRVGAAWDLSGKGTTVLRAGAGVFYDLLAVSVFTDQPIFLQNGHTPGISKIPTGALFVQPDGSTTPGPGTIATAAFRLPGSALNWSVAGPVLPLNQVACGDGVTSVTSGPASLIGATPAPCNIFAVDPNFRTPMVETWSLSLQHAFTNALSLELAYIGNHGSHLTGVQDVNQLDPQSAAEIACGHCEANANRPYGSNSKYPDLGVINVLGNPYRSNYHGLQATLTGRDYHGMSFVAGYTFAHALDDIAFSVLSFTPQDSRNPGAEYGNSDFDARHRFTLSWSYKIPGIKSPAQLLQGWQINTIVTLQSPQPWNVFDTTDDTSRTGEFQDRWNFFGNPRDFKASGTVPLPFFKPGPGPSDPNDPTYNSFAIHNSSCASLAGAPNSPGYVALQSYGCYVQGNSVMIPPAAGTYGNMGRNIFRDTGYRNVDFSVFKTFTFKERYSAQFRAEFFNVFNHPIFANPWGSINGYGNGASADPSSPGNFGCGCQTPDVAATNPVLGSGGARAIQLGLKLIF